MKTAEDKILPCPFCGGETKIEQISHNGLQIRCSSCAIGLKQKTLKFGIDWLKGKMIKTWNKRIIQFKDGVDEFDSSIPFLLLYRNAKRMNLKEYCQWIRDYKLRHPVQPSELEKTQGELIEWYDQHFPADNAHDYKDEILAFKTKISELKGGGK